MVTTEHERVRQYAHSRTRMYSHLLGNLVPLYADKVGPPSVYTCKFVDISKYVRYTPRCG